MKSLIVAAVLALCPLLAACAAGSAVVTGQIRPALPPAAVTLYAAAPAGAKVVGLVTASASRMLPSFSQQGRQDSAVEELRQQAASLGANGLVVTQVGATGGWGSTPSVSGTAIWVDAVEGSR